MTLRLFVTGATGQVATALTEAGPRRGLTVTAIGRPDLDLETADADAVTRLIEASGADVVVSAAAYTAVDHAESEPDRAFRINRDGAAAVARAAARLGLPLLHLSTDYVFDGSKPEPYRESDPTAPLGVYGRSKRDGELAVLEAHPSALVLRTAWVYGPTGANFLRTMLRLAGERERLRVVDDQIGNPTSALDIAEALIDLALKATAPADTPAIGAGAPERAFSPAMGGIFHMTAAGETSWCGFARAIMAGSAARGARAVPVDAIGTADYPTPARRPANSRLDCSRLAEHWAVRLPDWRHGLGTVLDRLLPPLSSKETRSPS